MKDDGRPGVAQRGRHVIVRLARVHDDGLPDLGRECELGVKSAPLCRTRGMVVVVVEPGFAEGNDGRQREQHLQALRGLGGPVFRFVGMHTCRRRESGPARGQRGRAFRVGDGRPDHHHMPHTGCSSAREHRVAVGVERRIAEMAVGVDQHPQSPSAPTRDPRTAAGAARFAVAVPTRTPPSIGHRWRMYSSTTGAMNIEEKMPVKIPKNITNANG